MPSEIDPQSGFRLPLPNREDLDDIGKAAYDRGMRRGATMMGLQGPAGIQLYTKGAPHIVALNQYLRFKSGIAPRTREIAILITAREMNSQFEWAAHEPIARAEGTRAEAIAVVRDGRRTDGLTAREAVLVDTVRALVRTRGLTAPEFARAEAALGARGLVELVTLAGYYAMIGLGFVSTVAARSRTFFSIRSPW